MQQADDPIPGFDEETYLAANADVGDAVRSGEIASGLEHYRQWGKDERRRGAPAAEELSPAHPSPARRVYQPIGAMPPAELLARVSGGASSARIYQQIGQSACDDILDAMQRYRIDPTSVLDFGSGCGRVVRHFATQCAARIDASDIDAEAIAWCQSNLGRAATFHPNPEWPPLPFEDDRFDLIYAVSVFTHFPEDMQRAWLAELRRVARPNAWLLLSVHAPRWMPPGHPELDTQLADSGFGFLRGSETYGLPDYYHAAFHSEAYIRREWGKLFQIEAVLSGGMNHHQDLVVARVRDSRSFG